MAGFVHFRYVLAAITFFGMAVVNMTRSDFNVTILQVTHFLLKIKNLLPKYSYFCPIFSDICPIFCPIAFNFKPTSQMIDNKANCTATSANSTSTRFCWSLKTEELLVASYFIGYLFQIPGKTFLRKVITLLRKVIMILRKVITLLRKVIPLTIRYTDCFRGLPGRHIWSVSRGRSEHVLHYHPLLCDTTSCSTRLEESLRRQGPPGHRSFCYFPGKNLLLISLYIPSDPPILFCCRLPQSRTTL